LHTADFNRSVAFYRDLLGFEMLSVFPDINPQFALMARDGVGIQIGGPEAKRAPADPPACTFYFDVSDALGLHAELKEKIEIEWGPEVFFYHRREFAFRDPDGHLIIVSEETDDSVTCQE
jgi:catechol 2,3-dioxygenase-like lactoylglutathione lyase family enzyme